MKRTIESIKEKEVVHCKTEAEAVAFCKMMHEAGLKWLDGDSYVRTSEFDKRKECTCYSPKSGAYVSISFATESGYTITPATDFIPDTTEQVKPEHVKHPAHYNTGKIEVGEFIQDQDLNFYSGNAVKYICRAGKKPGNSEVQDLKKGIQCMLNRVEYLERNQK